MDSNSGRITLSQAIAQTQEDIQKFVYELIVVATDDGGCCGGTNRLTSTGTVTINILTDNLNPPTFPDCSSYRPSVVEERANEPVIQVRVVALSKFLLATLSSKLFNEQFNVFFINLRKKPFGNIVGKGENVGFHHFHLFYNVF